MYLPASANKVYGLYQNGGIVDNYREIDGRMEIMAGSCYHWGDAAVVMMYGAEFAQFSPPCVEAMVTSPAKKPLPL